MLQVPSNKRKEGSRTSLSPLILPNNDNLMNVYNKLILPLHGVLNNEISNSFFKKYSIIEHSEENLLFYKDAIEFSKKSDRLEARMLLNNILKNYLLSGAVMQINISKSLLLTIQNYASSNDNIPPYILYELTAESLSSIQDTYRRFQKTESYNEMINALAKDYYYPDGMGDENRFLDNPLCFQLLREFLFAEKNKDDYYLLRFFLHARNFKSSLKPDADLILEAKNIYTRYFDENAQFKLRLSKEFLNSIKVNISNPKIDIYDEAFIYAQNIMLTKCLSQFYNSMEEIFLKSKYYEIVKKEEEFKEETNLSDIYLAPISLEITTINVKQLMRDKELRDIFLKFCEKECSSECVLFWIDAEEFRHLSTSKLQEKALRIYNTYIATNSEKEIPIDSHTKAFIKSKLDAVTADMYITLQTQTYEVIHNDSLRRFLFSPQYLKLVNKRKAIEVNNSEDSNNIFCNCCIL